MSTPPEHRPDDGPVTARLSSKNRRFLGYAIAIVLLASAGGVVWNQRGLVGGAIDHARSAPAWMLVALVLLPIAGWLVTGLSLWLLSLRFGRVGAGEMLALIGSAMLLNHLPMRPGMIGRIAYHARYNDIRVRDSVRVLFEATGITGLCALVLIGISLVLGSSGSALVVIASVVAPGVLCGVGALMTARTKRSVRLILAASALRYTDMLLWAVRYLVVFAAMGSPLQLSHAVLIASASQLAMMVPVIPAGLGLREWAVGFTGRSVSGGLGGALACDLVTRACELVVAVPIGLACMGYIARRTKRAEESGN